MEYNQHISKTDLARNTHHVIREAQKGYTVLVENHGQAEVVIVDIIKMLPGIVVGKKNSQDKLPVNSIQMEITN